MINKVNGKIGAIALAAMAFIAPTGASATEISLTFEDQNVTLVGEFAGFQKEAYIIVTDMGTLFVPAHYVTCEGEACFEMIAVEESDG